MRTNSLLTRCEQRAVRYLAMRTNSLLTPSKVRYISHPSHTPNIAKPHVASNVRYITFSMRTNSFLYDKRFPTN